MTIRSLLVLSLLLACTSARAALNVLACEPEWGALVKELAGERAAVYNATTAMQDVHRIQARPSLIAAARRADLLVCTGAGLEAGWLPVLIRESGNARIQPGTPGYFEASASVVMLDVPTRVDRSEGDVHPQGNPHIQTDPRNIAKVAAALAERLAQVDSANAAAYRSRHLDFDRRWREAMARWEKQAAPLKGVRVLEHHKAFTYLFHWLGIDVAGYLEPKPGVEPTTGHLAGLLEGQKAHPAKFVVRASYVESRASDWISGRARIPVVVLPFSVGGDEQAKDLFSWYEDLLARLLGARQ